MTRMKPAETSHLQRFYYDASHWSRLLDHPKREEILNNFDRSRRIVLPSIVNAAELLNTPATPDDKRRAGLCSLMASLQEKDHVMLPHPDEVLKAAAEAYRRRDSQLTLSDTAASRVFRRLISNPRDVDTDEDLRKLIKDWPQAMKRDTREFRPELRQILGEEGFIGEADKLPRQSDFSTLLYHKIVEVREAAASADEVLPLIQGTSVWAAYAASIAYEFYLRQRSVPARERARPPGGPDMRQLAYLGLVNCFVLRDGGFYRAAKWVANLMPENMHVEVITSADYFAGIGYPFPDSPPA